SPASDQFGAGHALQRGRHTIRMDRALTELGVVVAGLAGVDLGDRLQTGRLVERARGDRYRRSLDGLPEQARSADGAEAARAAVGFVPAQRGLGDELEVLGRARRVGRHVAVRAATPRAVTDDDVTQWSVDDVAH